MRCLCRSQGTLGTVSRHFSDFSAAGHRALFLPKVLTGWIGAFPQATRCFHSALLDRKAPVCRDEPGAPLAHKCDKALRPHPLAASSPQPRDQPLCPPCPHLGLDTWLERVRRGDATARDAHLLMWITERASPSVSVCGWAQQALPNATWNLGKARQKRHPGWAVCAPWTRAGRP